ncbi:MAG: type II secretion system F family protein [Planctomycetes bacterium]|nr:type II secretion system F family protein [Planctomycetota bacterium]
MADFTYIARNTGGQCIEGVLSAGTEREAIAALSAQQLFPVEIKAAGKAPERTGSRKVKAPAMVQFYVQLAALMRSGVPLLRALEVLERQTTVPALEHTLHDIHSRITEGQSLPEAMARHPKAFDELALSMIRAGSEGGFLEESLERVAKFTDQQAEMKGRVLGAMAYPMFLSAFSVVIVTVLVVFFVPKFESLFSRLRERGELPAVTDWLLWFSNFVTSYGIFVAIAGVGIFFLVRAQLATEAGRWFLDRWRLKIPQVGAIYRNLAVSRFCRVLGTLLSGGVPIVAALKISSGSTGNKVLSKAIDNAADNITSGEALATPLMASGHFPPDIVEMIAVAEQSNTLEKVLTDIAEALEKQTWRRLDLVVRLVEPLMLLVMASAVLLIVVALLLPMLKSAMAI